MLDARCRRIGKSHEHKAATEQVECRAAVAQPGMGRAAAGTCGRHIILGVVLRWWRAIADADRRRFVAVAKLQSGSPEHSPDLADQALAELLPHALPGCRVIFNRAEFVAEFAVRQIKLRGHADVAVTYRSPLAVIGGEQIRAAPAGERSLELPAEINRIADPGIHAQRAGGRKLMHRIAGEKDTAATVAVGNDAASCPNAQALPFHVDASPDSPLQ